MDDLVSIIVPVYNKEAFVKQCILSIERQTHKNIEIIIVDDGSKDDSINIIQNIMKESKLNIRLIKQENQGPSGARNTGLSYATGDYVVFLDADDWLTERNIEISLELAKEYDADIVEYDFSDNCESEVDAIERKVFNEGQILREYIYGLCIKPVVCGAMYTRAVISNVRFDKNMKWGEDGCFKLDCILNSRCVVYTNQRLYINNILFDNTLSRLLLNEEIIQSYLHKLNHYKIKLTEYNCERTMIGYVLFRQAYKYAHMIVMQNRLEQCKKGFVEMQKICDDNISYVHGRKVVYKIGYYILKHNRKLYKMIYYMIKR